MLYWIIKNLQIYAAAITIVITVINIIGSGLWRLFDLGYRKKLSNDFEKYKTDLQVMYLKEQMKTTQHFEIYPKIFSKIKMAEASLAIVYILRNKHKSDLVSERSCAEKDVIEANNIIVFNLLFLPQHIQELCIQLKDQMSAYLYNNTLNGAAVTFEQISKGIDILEQKLKKELGFNQ